MDVILAGRLFTYETSGDIKTWNGAGREKERTLEEDDAFEVATILLSHAKASEKAMDGMEEAQLE